MKRKFLKALLYFLGILATLIIALTITLWVKSPGVTQTILDAHKKPVESSISEIEKVILGGQEQYIIIRGADKTKPVMLFLHGGPGSPEVAFIKHFNSEIENDYVMVYWEQRGAGKSYSKKIPAGTMNLQQMIADTRELSEYLINRFGCEKIYLMGHSWGSLLGMQTAYLYPDLYDAYFGIGQVCHQYMGEQLSYSWTLDQAVERNDTKAIELLENLGVPDSTGNIDQWLNYLMKQRRYVNKYGGGTTREMPGMWPLVKIVMNSGIYTLGEKLNFMNASMFSLEHMWLDVINSNLFTDIDSMQVPVYILHGTYDNTTPFPLAKEFYEQLKAPQKGFFSFENSAHSPIMEEPEKFNSILRKLTVDLSSVQCLR
jgi:pimeloyl-ACP methyl ester carboxylesterase